MVSDSKHGALDLEMETLVEAHGGDDLHHPKHRTTSSKWVALLSIAVIVLVTAGEAYIKSMQGVDRNTMVTDIDKLPAAEEQPMGDSVQRHPQEALSSSSESNSMTTPADNDMESAKPEGEIKMTTPPPPPKKPPKTDMPRPEEPAGYKHPASYFSDVYLRRARSDRKTAFADEWGSWTFKDPHPDNRLSADDWESLMEKYPNRDIPREDIPSNAWQTDPAYLKPWLEQSIALTERGIKAILAEYGHYDVKGGVPLEMAMADADETQNAFMFNLTVLEHGKGYPNPKHTVKGNAGYVSPTAWKRLKRLLLHAVVTQDKFFLTMGGHSSAAAHGNHFQQSYTLQIQRALEPLLARLGVYHQARNVGMGGLGTTHNSLGAQSMYGGDNALLLWDSGMYVP